MADLSTCPPLTRASVVAAHELIKPHVHLTPVLTNTTLSQLASTPQAAASLTSSSSSSSSSSSPSPAPAKPVIRLWFKCENLQRIGAFKARGAFHAVERLKKDAEWVKAGGMEKGVVSHSSGNHAAALALAARESGIPAHIVMPEISARPKIAATKGYGANVIFSGSTSKERQAVADRVIQETGARFVPPFDHPDIMLGQGTLGLEFQEQVEQLQLQQQKQQQQQVANGSTNGTTKRGGLDAIIAPCGGGGMLSGVALSCEGTGIRVFGAEPEFQGADDAKRGFETGRRIEAVATLTIADGLRTQVGALPWGVIYERRLVQQMFSVTEAEIVAALRLVLERMKIVVEPSAVVPLAVVLFNEDFRRLVEEEAGAAGWDIGVVFSGGNVALEQLGELFAS